MPFDFMKKPEAPAQTTPNIDRSALLNAAQKKQIDDEMKTALNEALKDFGQMFAASHKTAAA